MPIFAAGSENFALEGFFQLALRRAAGVDFCCGSKIFCCGAYFCGARAMLQHSFVTLRD